MHQWCWVDGVATEIKALVVLKNPLGSNILMVVNVIKALGGIS